jgi:hypothetical protein
MMVLNHFPENLRNYHENSKQFQKILGNFPNQLSSFQDSSTGAENPETINSEGFTKNGDSTKTEFNHPTVEESRAENTRFSASTEAKASAGETTSAPGGAAVSSTGGISDAEIAQLKRDPKYAGKDIDEVIRKCRAKYPDRPIMLKRERGTLTSTPEPSKAGNPYSGSMAGLYDYLHRDWSSIKKMPPEKRDGDAAKWLHVRVRVDGDVQGCLQDLAWGRDILDYFLPDEFESSDKGDEMLLAGCDWIGRMDENHNTRLKGSKWLVSKAQNSSENTR